MERFSTTSPEVHLALPPAGCFVVEQFESTYKLEPEDGQRFVASDAEPVMLQILQNKLKDATYDVHRCRRECLELASAIKGGLLAAMALQRYKVIVQVAIAQRAGQGLHVGSRGLWSTAVDCWAAVSFVSEAIAATAVVFACYNE
eukprot:GHVT01099149.1.p1 GENE.GHVT01099149.1~~GHVT01099149.1.p1  ORF type:complete len:145 (+),score=39.73 GHVT01099149.1:597-1031(+)